VALDRAPCPFVLVYSILSARHNRPSQRQRPAVMRTSNAGGRRPPRLCPQRGGAAGWARPSRRPVRSPGSGAGRVAEASARALAWTTGRCRRPPAGRRPPETPGPSRWRRPALTALGGAELRPPRRRATRNAACACEPRRPGRPSPRRRAAPRAVRRRSGVHGPLPVVEDLLAGGRAVSQAARSRRPFADGRAWMAMAANGRASQGPAPRARPAGGGRTSPRLQRVFRAWPDLAAGGGVGAIAFPPATWGPKWSAYALPEPRSAWLSTIRRG